MRRKKRGWGGKRRGGIVDEEGGNKAVKHQITYELNNRTLIYRL